MSRPIDVTFGRPITAVSAAARLVPLPKFSFVDGRLPGDHGKCVDDLLHYICVCDRGVKVATHARELAAAEEAKHSAVAGNHSENQRLFEERESELNSRHARELAAAEEVKHSAVAANHSETQRLFEERGSELNSTHARELAAGEEVKHSTVAANHSEKRPHDLRCPSETDDNACSGQYGTCCTEIDLWEANRISAAFTTHTCTTKGDTPGMCHGTKCDDSGEDRSSGVCGKNSCDIQAWRFGVRNFYGPRDRFKVNSAKPVTVTTQFLTDDGTGSGTINKFKQFYTQNGKTVDHSMCTVNGKP